MSFTTTSMPLKGLRQIQMAPWISDGVIGDTFLLPYPQALSSEENQVVKELPGGDVTADKSVTIKSLTMTIRWARIKLSQLSDLLGATFTTTGSTPNQVHRLRRYTSDTGGYFQLKARVAYVGSEFPDGDYTLLAYKGKIVGTPKISYATEEYATVEVVMEFIERDDLEFYEMLIAETGTALTAAAALAAPTLNTISPADNATGVATSANVVITFNAGIMFNALDYALLKVVTPASSVVEEPCAVTYDSGTFAVTMNPTSTLGATSTYNVRLGAGIRALDGTVIASAANYQFTTT